MVYRGIIVKLILFLLSVLAEQSDWVSLMIWLSICGFFRGMCLSNFTLTISEYCPLEKLPAAFGLHMVSKGVFVVIIGPIIGKYLTHLHTTRGCNETVQPISFNFFKCVMFGPASQLDSLSRSVNGFPTNTYMLHR